MEHPRNKLVDALVLIGVWLCSFGVLIPVCHLLPRDEWATPFIWFAIFSAALPVTYYLLHRESPFDERLRTGKCIHCGYDMRETPARCPECGNVPNYARIDRAE